MLNAVFLTQLIVLLMRYFFWLLFDIMFVLTDRCDFAHWLCRHCLGGVGLAADRPRHRPARCAINVTHPVCADWSVGPGRPCGGCGANDTPCWAARHGVRGVELSRGAARTAAAAVAEYDAAGVDWATDECGWPWDSPTPRTARRTCCVWWGHLSFVDARRPTIGNHDTAECPQSHAGMTQFHCAYCFRWQKLHSTIICSIFHSTRKQHLVCCRRSACGMVFTHAMLC